ncbi:class I SAM-dependent methyltransferase [Pseudomonas sp. TH32]|uniref:methyltransferase domain-containing protein n=1 Tax=Pseudomonas sp. TH32 TaxID=2796397 RepID=UPI001912CBDF|nr:methyltransferase domain-containing protein [Pseudomonas sp. TH32]MBK5437903.1 class I SAM-dependent methyltransferase [Pseudomonas sp. TH32]
MNNNVCPICSSNLSVGIQVWHFRCTSCGYEKGDLQPVINELSPHNLVNESVRATGLRDIRVGNFKKLIDVISSFKPGGGKLIDVGCAHGWFLEAAMGKFETLGVEPDEAVFNVTSARGLPVRKGYFPDALKDGEMFDVIVFNDVIEHIPEIGGVLSECYERLNGGGLLVLNLPSSDGVFYKVSRLFCRVEKFGYFERLWQKDLPSPHVHYFNSKNLSELLTKNNFATIKTGTLPTLGLAGLYSRISCAGNLGAFSKAIIYCAVAASLPVLRLLPSDIVYVVAKKA